MDFLTMSFATADFASETLEVGFHGESFQIKTSRPTLKQTFEREGFRGLGRGILSNWIFENAMCLVVVVNACCMAVEQSQRLAGRDTAVFSALDQLFLAVYCLHLALQFFAFGREAWSSNWVKFDVVLVLLGVISSCLTYMTHADVGGSNKLLKLMALRMLRLLRLVRVARTLRLLAYCQELWMLARGLLNSFSTAFYTLFFGAVLLFVVGCLAVELLPLTLLRDGTADGNEAVKGIIEESFSDLPSTMLTLVQFITFDNVVLIYRPLIEEDPLLAIFFIVVLLLVGVVFMNIVTAIIVNSGLEQSMMDRNTRKVALEKQRRQLLKDLEQAFYRMDTNCSGTLCKQELSNIDSESLSVLEACLGLDNLVQMFDVLDVEGDGELNISEFCNGITSIVLAETQPEVKRMVRLAESLNRSMKRCELVQIAIQESVHEVLGSLAHMSQRINDLDSSSDMSSEEQPLPLSREATRSREETMRSREETVRSREEAACLKEEASLEVKATPWEAFTAELQQLRQLLLQGRDWIPLSGEEHFSKEADKRLLEEPHCVQDPEELWEVLPCDESGATPGPPEPTVGPQQPMRSLAVPAMLQSSDAMMQSSDSGSNSKRSSSRRRTRRTHSLGAW